MCYLLYVLEYVVKIFIMIKYPELCDYPTNTTRAGHLVDVRALCRQNLMKKSKLTDNINA